MKRAGLIALWVCSCHAYDQAYLDCMSTGHCADATSSDAGLSDAGLSFDDNGKIDLGIVPNHQRSATVSRNLSNPRPRFVPYVLTYDPHLDINYAGVDGGPACTQDGIPADSVCRWDIALVPDVAQMFNGTIYLDSDAGNLSLNVQADVR